MHISAFLNLEDTMLREINQSPKDEGCLVPPVGKTAADSEKRLPAGRADDGGMVLTGIVQFHKIKNS